MKEKEKKQDALIVKRKLFWIFLTILLLGQSLFLSGCWSVHEVEDLAILTGGTVDLIKENGKDIYVTDSLIVRPSNQGMQSEQSFQSGNSGIWIEGKGENFSEAYFEANKQLPRIFTQNHAGFGIMGERAAKEIVAAVLENHLRYPGIRPNEYFFVTRGEASRISLATPVVLSFSEQLKRQPDISLQTGVSCSVTLTQFFIWLLSHDRDPVLPELKLVNGEKGKTVVTVEGFGFFRDDKLAGWLDKEEAKGYLLMTRNLNSTKIPITFTIDQRALSYTLIASKYKIEPKKLNDKLSFKVTIQTQGSIIENQNYPVTAENVKELEQAIGEEIKKLPLKTIAKAQEYGSDFLGLMEYLHRHNPAVWQEVKPNWRKSFCNANIEVEVKAKIVSGGMGKKAFNTYP